MENDELTEDERRVLAEMKDNWQRQKSDEKLFWKNIYTAYSFDERVGFWSGVLHRQMRWQPESGLDPYAPFSRLWYEDIKEKEPNIDKIIDLAFEKTLSWEWSKEEFLRRIGR